MKSIRAVACCAVVGAALAGAAGGFAQSAPASPDAKRLIGTWRLIGYESSDPEARQVRGPAPSGLLYYDTTGHMAVQIAPDRVRHPFTGPASGIFTGPRPTAAEALDAISGYGAYFGTYTVDERAKTVTHKRSGNLNPAALGDFVRRYEFRNADELVLVPQDRTDLRSVRLSWKLLK